MRKAARQVDRVAAGHHDILIAIRHQNRLPDRAKILLRLHAPGLDRLELLTNTAIVIGLSRSTLRSFNRSRKACAARRPLAVEVKSLLAVVSG
jgi:hypothetical protein